MSKKFTDNEKWRSEWFRDLPTEAKLVWIYLWDDCDSTGIWKIDMGLLQFQVGFLVKIQDLFSWFHGHFEAIDAQHIIILDYFYGQYGSSKDSWAAKAGAMKRLELLGFAIESNHVLPRNLDNQGQSRTVPDCPGQSLTVLSKGKGKGKGKGNLGGLEPFANPVQSGFDIGDPPEPIPVVAGLLSRKGKPTRADFAAVYKEHYPRKEGKSEGLDSLEKQKLTWTEFDQLVTAIKNFKNRKAGKDADYLPYFSSFVSGGKWRDWLDDDAGTTKISRTTVKNERKPAEAPEVERNPEKLSEQIGAGSVMEAFNKARMK